tara:strand:+ start:250 stop:393 length:144 start_codon:yes stop_codon:yes gene_type:complete
MIGFLIGEDSLGSAGVEEIGAEGKEAAGLFGVGCTPRNLLILLWNFM